MIHENLQTTIVESIKSYNSTDILFKISINDITIDVVRNNIICDKFDNLPIQALTYLIRIGKYMWLTLFGNDISSPIQTLVEYKSEKYCNNIAYIYLLKYICRINDTDIVQSFYNDSNTNVSKILHQYLTSMCERGLLNIVTTDPNHLFCIDCYNCTTCQFCIGCSNSENLTNCDNCIDCKCMQNCSDCIECNDCSDSQKLRFSTRMISCKYCNYCNECYASSYAFDCISCYKIYGCIGCKNCEISRNLIRCYACNYYSNQVYCYNKSNYIDVSNGETDQKHRCMQRPSHSNKDNPLDIVGDWPELCNSTLNWVSQSYCDFDDDWSNTILSNYVIGPDKINYIQAFNEVLPNINSVLTCHLLVTHDKRSLKIGDKNAKSTRRKINKLIYTFKLNMRLIYDFNFKSLLSDKQIIDLNDEGYRVELNERYLFMYDTNNNLLFKGLYSIDEKCDLSYNCISTNNALKYIYVILGTFYYADIQKKCCNMYMTTNPTWIENYIEYRLCSKSVEYKVIYNNDDMLEIFRTRRIYLENIIKANDRDLLLDLVTNHVMSGEFNFIDIYDRNEVFVRSYATFGA